MRVGYAFWCGRNWTKERFLATTTRHDGMRYWALHLWKFSICVWQVDV